MAADAPTVVHRRQHRAGGRREETGDLDAGFKQAAHVVEADLLDARHHARAASRRTARVCEWDGDKLTAWVSTQGVARRARRLRAAA